MGGACDAQLGLAQGCGHAEWRLMPRCAATRRDEDGFLYISYSGENTFGAAAGWEKVDA